MSRASAIMQGLKRRLEFWKPRMIQTAMLNELEFEMVPDGINITARWKTKVDEGEHKVHISREKVLGRTLTSPVPRPIKKACDFRDDVVREIVQHRTKR